MMGRPDVRRDAERAFAVLKRGGIAILPMSVGYSANRSLSGTKFRVEDIEPELLGIADIVIDHGLRLYHLYRASSTLLDLETFEVVRYGACFELIADALKRRFGIALAPPPPGHIRTLISPARAARSS